MIREKIVLDIADFIKNLNTAETDFTKFVKDLDRDLELNAEINLKTDELTQVDFQIDSLKNQLLELEQTVEIDGEVNPEVFAQTEQLKADISSLENERINIVAEIESINLSSFSGEVRAEVDTAAGEFERLGDVAKTTGLLVGDSLTDGINNSTSAIDNFAASAFQINNVVGLFQNFTNIIGSVVSGFQNLTQAANVQESAERQLAVALQQSGEYTEENFQSMKDYASELQKASTTGDEVVLQQLRLANALGFTADESKQAVSSSLALEKQFESLGLSSEAALRGLANATEGNFSQLERYIPELRGAVDETEKWAIIQKNVNAGLALQSDELETAAGKFAQFNNRIGDIQEVVGGFVNEIGLLLAPFIEQIIEFVEVELPKLLAKIKPFFTQLVAFISPIISFFIKNLDIFIPILAAVGVALVLLTAKVVALNIAMYANPVGLIVVGIAALIAGLALAYKEFDSFRNIVDTVFDGIKVAITAVAEGIKQIWEFLQPIVEVVWNVLRIAFKITFELALMYIKLLIKGYTAIWEAIKFVAKIIYDFLKPAIDFIKKLFLNWLESTLAAFRKLNTVLKQFANFLGITTESAKDLSSETQKTTENVEKTGDAMEANLGILNTTNEIASDGVKLGSERVKQEKSLLEIYKEQLQTLDKKNPLYTEIFEKAADLLFNETLLKREQSIRLKALENEVALRIRILDLYEEATKRANQLSMIDQTPIDELVKTLRDDIPTSLEPIKIEFEVQEYDFNNVFKLEGLLTSFEDLFKRSALNLTKDSELLANAIGINLAKSFDISIAKLETFEKRNNEVFGMVSQTILGSAKTLEQGYEDAFTKVVENADGTKTRVSRSLQELSENGTEIIGVLATNMISAFVAFREAGESVLKAFGKSVVITAIETMDALIPIFIARIFGEYASLGPGGIAAAAAVTVLLKSLAAAAKAGVAGAEKGEETVSNNSTQKRGATDTILRWVAPGEAIIPTNIKAENKDLIKAWFSGITTEQYLQKKINTDSKLRSKFLGEVVNNSSSNIIYKTIENSQDKNINITKNSNDYSKLISKVVSYVNNNEYLDSNLSENNYNLNKFAENNLQKLSNSFVNNEGNLKSFVANNNLNEILSKNIIEYNNNIDNSRLTRERDVIIKLDTKTIDYNANIDVKVGKFRIGKNELYAVAKKELQKSIIRS
jgi:hypothetical protein